MKWLATPLATGLAMAIFGWIVSLTPIAHRFDNQYGLSALYALRGPVRAPEDVVVIALDRNTIKWLRHIEDRSPKDAERLRACMPTNAFNELSKIRGPSSLPRSLYGCLVKELTRLGYPAVAFDVLFSVKGNKNDDGVLAAAIEEHGTVVLLVGVERSSFEEHQVGPADPFAAKAAGTGAFLVSRSGGPVYGYWRSPPGFEDMQSLPDETHRLYRRQTAEVAEKPAFEYFWLYGPPGTIKAISIRDVLSGETTDAVRAAAPQSAAFIGAADAEMMNFPDSFPSLIPSESQAGMAGVELAATAFSNLTANQHLRPLSPLAESALIFSFSFLLGFLVQARGRFAMFVAPFAAVLYLAAAALAFSFARLFLPIFTPILVVAPVAFVVAGLVRYRFARALLMRLAPAPVARRMLTRTTDARAEAVADEATAVFLDLAGSTAIAEKMTPVAYSKLLNNLHETVKASVEERHGLVVAFAGDGVMAAFTRSDAGADHALHACNAAIYVVHGLRAINEGNLGDGLPAFRIRIGINSGSVAEAEIGARDRFNFSVVGDVVNLASRLEQLGKALFPNEIEVILVGQSTYNLVRGRGLDFVDCGVQQIAGRERSERVYRIRPD